MVLMNHLETSAVHSIKPGHQLAISDTNLRAILFAKACHSGWPAIAGLMVEPVFEHDQSRSDQNLAVPSMILMDLNIGHVMAGATGRLLPM